MDNRALATALRRDLEDETPVICPATQRWATEIPVPAEDHSALPYLLVVFCSSLAKADSIVAMSTVYRLGSRLENSL